MQDTSDLKEKDNPADFYVTLDGSDAIYWTCASGQACMHGDPVADIKRCLEITGKNVKNLQELELLDGKMVSIRAKVRHQNLVAKCQIKRLELN